MTSYTNYLRCDDCGVDAGHECMGLDNRPALEVCDGRELGINDSAARTKCRPAGTSERTRARRRQGVGVPVMVACEHCGAQARLWGQGLVTGRAYCSTPVCQQARRRHQDARARASAPPPPPRVCEVCGRECPPCGRRFCGPTCQRRATRARAARDDRPCVVCGAPVDVVGMPAVQRPACPGACRVERERRRVAARQAEIDARAARPRYQPCPVCGDMPVAHDHRSRIYCSDTCRSTAKSRRQRLPNATDPQQHHAP